MIIFLCCFSFRLLRADDKGSQLQIVKAHDATRSAGRWFCQRGWPNQRITRDTGRDRGYNGAGRHHRWLKVEDGTQVAVGFWGGIDWKPLAFAKGLGRGSGRGSDRDRVVQAGRFGGLWFRRHNDDKSHMACGLVTPFAQRNVVETLLLPAELCTLNAFSGQRRAAGVGSGRRQQEAAKVCHDSFAIVPKD